MVKITVKSNMDGVIKELEDFVKKFNGSSIKASLWSEVLYAKYVEEGTYKMAPRAMVRQSMPAIEAYFEAEWAKMPFPFKDSDLRALWNRTIEFAKAEISKRTPVKTGVLKSSWQTTKARIYKGVADKE